MTGQYLDCGCYLRPDGGITRCPRHDAEIELSSALADLYREFPDEQYRPPRPRHS